MILSKPSRPELCHLNNMSYQCYRKYLRRIVKYSKKRGVKLCALPDLSCGGAFIHSFFDKKGGKNRIYVDTLLPPSERIAILLHEIGHHLDYCGNSESFFTRDIIEARFRHDKNLPLTQDQKKKLLISERRAWKKAESLATRLEIELGDWFNKERNKDLASYIRIPVLRYL